MASSRTTGICDLPPNVILSIFRFLSKTDLLKVTSQTCQLWKQLSYEKSLWRNIDAHDFPEHAFTSKTFIDLLADIHEAVEKLTIDLCVIDLCELRQSGLFFPNLKSLLISKPSGLKGTDSWVKEYQWLANSYPDLKELHLDQTGDLLVNNFTLPKLETFIVIGHPRSGLSQLACASCHEFLKCLPVLSKLVLKKSLILPETVQLILTSFPSLEVLEISSTRVAFSEINEVVSTDDVQLEKLKELNVNDSDIGDGLLQKIVMKSNGLKYLNVESCNNVTYAGINAVAQNCSRLCTLVINSSIAGDYLEFERCPLTSAAIQRIAEYCSKLSVLRISHCPEVGDIGILAIATSCPELSELLVAGCLSLQDSTVRKLVEKCPKLQTLDFANCVQLSAVSVNCVLKKSSHLQLLDISMCLRVTEVLLLESSVMGGTGMLLHSKVPSASVHSYFEDHAVKSSCTWDGENLDMEGQNAFEAMNAEGLHEIESSIKVLPDHCHISVLNLSFCSKITNADIKQIATFCPDLRNVNIQACYMVTNAGVKALLQKCRFLRILNISGGSISQTSRLTDDCLSDIGKYGRQIEDLIVIKNFNITVNGVLLVIQNCEKICSLRIEVGPRSNISKEVLIQMSQDLKDKTTCLQFKGDAEIRIYRNAEFKLMECQNSSD